MLFRSCDNRSYLKGVEVILSDSFGNEKKYSTVSNESGDYKFKVNRFEPFNITYKLKNYISKSVTMKSPKEEEVFVLNSEDLCLVQLKEKKSIVLERIYFEYNKASLLPESELQLDSLINILNDNPSMFIQIDAHTDSVGSEKYNLDLSDSRAKSVVTYLVQKGINKERLSSKGYGESMPLEPNSNPDGTDNPIGRARNRRCAFTIFKM